MRVQNNNGFTILEAVIVMAIAILLTAISISILPGILNSSAVDSGYSQTIGALRSARQLAIDQMEQVEVTFSGSGTSPATITYENQTPGGSGSAGLGSFNGTASLANTVILPVRVKFALPASAPSSAPETIPSGMWVITSTVPVSFSPIVMLGGTNASYTATGTNSGNIVVFEPDGTAQCPVTGATTPLPTAGVCNGVVYLLDVKGDSSTLRAITLFGATGRTAGYRYTGGGWTPY